jgi:CDP-diacylglycerol--serine O-phosphatidyltransferase
MIREFHLADFFTLANAACGMGAVLLSMGYMGSRSVDYFFRAAALAPAALVFDALDGRRARWRRKHSALGASWIRSRTLFVWGRASGTRIRCSMHGGWDWIAQLYFVCCGVGRLAGFNVTAESLSEDRNAVAYFEGTSILTNVLLSGILALADWQGQLGKNLDWGVWTIGPWVCIRWSSCLSYPEP